VREEKRVTAPLSVQLYSLREEAKAGLRPVIERLANIGYAGVEVAGFHDLTPDALRRCVADAGMVVSGGHVPLPAPDDVDAVLDAQDALGSRMVVVAYQPPEAFTTEDAVRATADRLHAFGEAVRARGMALGYHNHWWEFATRIGARSAHQALFERLDGTIFAEIDTYWAKVGGADPARVVAAFGPRARLLHIKDGPADDPKSPMTAVGDGVLDVPAIVGASQSEWLVVELDRCATDMFQAVGQSFSYLVSHGYARGRRATE
jgi:sugar phosphate isomerase/epimerase